MTPVVMAIGLMLLGCGDDGNPTPPDSGPAVDANTAGDSGAAADTGPGRSDAGSNADAGSFRGCASPGGEACPGELMCCSGVPYPEEGICMRDCPLDSDRALKEGFASIDGDEVLDRLATLPVSRWSYRAEPGVDHIGPMAQDFGATFRVGKDDRHIHPVDAQGVTIAAIQALHRRVEALEGQNRALRSDCP